MSSLLLIEDELLMLESLSTALHFEGFEVHQAANGHDGLALARQYHPDLILCDIQMPGMDGFEVLAAVRADSSLGHTPFIFLTARGENTDLRKGMVSGADDYLVKPVAMEELLAAVRGRLARFARTERRAPDFSDARPLETLGLSPKESETLLWVAQGKGNAEVAAILDVSEATVKKHLEHVFAKLGVEKRGAASLLAIERLSR